MSHSSKQIPFFLTKVTEKKYANSLIKGEIYLQPIQNFWSLFSNEKSVKNSYRGDNLECLNAIFKFSDDFFYFPTIPTEIKNFVKNLGININDWSAIGLMDGSLGSEKIYCLYSLIYDDNQKKLIMPDQQLKSFGDTAVIIKEPDEFFGKISVALFKTFGDWSKGYENQPFWFCLDTVRYIIDRKQPENVILDEFCKDKEYSWQNEFRFVVDLSPNKTVHSLPVSDFGLLSGFPPPEKDTNMFEPLILQIGDISNICELVPTENLLKTKELEVLSSKLGCPKEVEFPVALYRKEPKFTVFRTILIPKVDEKGNSKLPESFRNQQ